MAYIVTVELLIDAPTQEQSNEYIKNLITEKLGDLVIDHSTTDSDPANESLNDSIANETYVVGDFQRDWVIFSQSEEDHSGYGYWSNVTGGWENLDLAARYSGLNMTLPNSIGNDAVFMLAPHSGF